ncbi:dethiobiotin synthase [Chitinophagaceae bacterium LWZ2-11]
MAPLFITGIGTDVGKTIVSAIVTEALQADYWKPVQAGFDTGTDALRVAGLVSNATTAIHREAYKLKLPASPHIAAKEENVVIDLDKIASELPATNNKYLVVEGAGGLLVPLNNDEFVLDLIVKLKAKVILVSRNYLGSINHSLLTAQACKQRGVDVLGWVFNDQYLHYEDEIVKWTEYPKIGSIPFTDNPDKLFVKKQAEAIMLSLQRLLL